LFASKLRVAILATVIGCVLVTGVVLSLTFGSAGPARSAAALATPVGTGHPATHPASHRPTTLPPPPLQVMSASPASGAHGVNGTDPVQVVFSAALAKNSPLPTFSPEVPGSWQAGHGSTMVFTPTTPFAPATEETLTIPAGASGVHSAGGALLAKPDTIRFETAGWSTVRLEQLLSQLGYLPLTWTPVSSGAGSPSPGGSGAGSPTALSYAQQLSDVYSPPAGQFTWQPGYPSVLTSQWAPGESSTILTGALMAFQSVHGLTMDGVAGGATWQAVLNAAAKGEDNPNGYTYGYASKASPETLTIYHDGKVVMHVLANTGIPAAPTADGTFPVYLRYRNQIMKGTNPDGTKYADPVQFVAYFDGGDAVHYFPRYSYGFPQSLGCVELSLSDAAQAWPYLSYGSLVTVAG
jgi:peptidoglycan hydrolase-like protein with peptidoglycan-binding domain